MKAELRVCASCEWIFKGGVECPQCQFGSYGAYNVYGRNAYRYAVSQKPWYDRKMASYSFKLLKSIKQLRVGTSVRKMSINLAQIPRIIGETQ